MPRHTILQNLKIVSGGQTGADRAALDWAIMRGLPHGGWCPHGRRAEDGTIHFIYRLVETPSPAYLQRTEWNVRDADATVIFSLAETLTGGSLATLQFAQQFQKPHLHLNSLHKPDKLALELLEFIRHQRIKILNIAGPSASKEPFVSEFVRQTLDAVWQRRKEYPHVA